MDRSARLFLCVRCRQQVMLCSHCDHGQLYCSPSCSAAGRHEYRRHSAQRYQGSRSGRLKHAARTACWRRRERQRQRCLCLSSAGVNVNEIIRARKNLHVIESQGGFWISRDVLGRLEIFNWWSRGESNPRPQAITGQFYMRSALV